MTATLSLTAADRPLGPLLIGLAGLEVNPEETTWLRHPAVGGVVLFTRNYHDLSQLSELTASISKIAGRNLLICVDHEGGRVQRFKDGFTRLPPLAVLGKMYTESKANALDFAYRHGRVMATELLLCGVDLSFAPVLDLGDRSVIIEIGHLQRIPRPLSNSPMPILVVCTMPGWHQPANTFPVMAR